MSAVEESRSWESKGRERGPKGHIRISTCACSIPGKGKGEGGSGWDTVALTTSVTPP